jgi:hypothetical protein
MASSGLTQVEREIRSIQGYLEKLAGKTAVLRAHVLAGEVLPAAMGRSAGRLAGLIFGDLDAVLASPPAVAHTGLPQQAATAADCGPGARCAAAAPFIGVHPVCPSERPGWASACTTDSGPASGVDRPAASAAIRVIDRGSAVEQNVDTSPAAQTPADVVGTCSGAGLSAQALAEPVNAPVPSAAAQGLADSVGPSSTVLSAEAPSSATKQEQDQDAPAPESACARTQEPPHSSPAPGAPAPHVVPARERAEQLLRAGVIDAEVVRQCKVSPKSVRKWRKALGLPASNGAPAGHKSPRSKPVARRRLHAGRPVAPAGSAAP